MSKKMIITIGREFGSGGHEIGEKLAQKLGINFYDKNLIELAAKQSGMDINVASISDEKAPSFLISPYTPTISDKLYIAECEVIQSLAENESFVIVGRCANSILKHKAKTLNVFIFAPLDTRIQRIMDRFLITSPQDAKKEILRIDKTRKSYYQYYSEFEWGHRNGYDVMIDSSILGIDGTVELLANIVHEKFK